MHYSLRGALRRAALMAGCALVGCSHAASLEPKVVAAEADAPSVLILESSDNPLITAPAATLRSELSGFTLYDETVTATTAWRTSLEALSPGLVIALGSKAAVLAREVFPTTPTLFAMVVSYQRIPALQHEQVAGIALEVPVLSEFTQFKMILPHVHDVVAFYDPSVSSAHVTGAQEALRELNVTLKAVPVTGPNDLEAQYAAQASGADAVWLLNDPTVMNARAFQFLKERSHATGVPLLASLSEQLARQGALMAVSFELQNIGFQLASMARNMLEQHKQPAELGVQPPIGARLTLNMDVARKLQLDVPPEVLPFVGEIIDSALARQEPHKIERD